MLFFVGFCKLFLFRVFARADSTDLPELILPVLYRVFSFCYFTEILIQSALLMSKEQQNNGQSMARTRRRLRVQPLARDSFATFTYACITTLLFCEIIAFFWLDIF